MGIYWTIQTSVAWEKAKQLGYLIGDKRYVWTEFTDAYHWMMKQMKNKITNYSGEYPIWLWTERPDLRKNGHLETGVQGVLLKVDIDSSRVLLSDFLAWHQVLYNDYLSLDCNEIPNNSSVHTIEQSWLGIFDLEVLKKHPDWGEVRHQGVTGKVFVNEISVVKEFKAR